MDHLDHLIAGSSLKQTNETIQTNLTDESHGREQPTTKKRHKGETTSRRLLPCRVFFSCSFLRFFVQIFVLDV